MQSLPKNYLLQNRYKIEKILGKGGFGLAYLVSDIKNKNKKLVIKEFFWNGQVSREKGDSYITPYDKNDYNKLLKAFQEEANMTFKLKHPSIVNVIAGFNANNTAYYVMDFIEGETLQEKMRRDQKIYSQTEIIEIILPILDGLEYIHSLGYLHRDMAPDNIYLKNYKDAIIFDFGSSRRVIGKHTQSITALVKHGYSPPEQYTGTTKEQRTPSTDIYPIAAIIYRLLNGEVPYSATDRQNSLFNDNVELIDDICIKFKGQYSDDFLKAIKKGFELKPRDRYQTIAKFRKDLIKSIITTETTLWNPNNELTLGSQCPPVTQMMKTYEIRRDNNERTFNEVSSKYWMYFDKEGTSSFMKVVYLNNHSINIDLNELADEVSEDSRRFFNVDNYTLAGAIKEINVLSKLNHENIIKIKKINKYNGHLHIYYDLETLKDFKTLEQCMNQNIQYEEKYILNFGLTMLDTIKYLEENHITHERITPRNILIVNNKPILFEFNTSIQKDNIRDIGIKNDWTMPVARTTDPYFSIMDPLPSNLFSLGMTLYLLAQKDKNIVQNIPTFSDRACAITDGGKDPIKPIKNSNYSQNFKDTIMKSIQITNSFQSAQEMMDALKNELSMKKKSKLNLFSWLKK